MCLWSLLNGRFSLFLLLLAVELDDRWFYWTNNAEEKKLKSPRCADVSDSSRFRLETLQQQQQQQPNEQASEHYRAKT